MAFDVIPAIDIRDGNCVRLEQGDFKRETVYVEDPVEIARRWADQGARRIHVVDLDAARTGEPVNLAIVSNIAKAVSIPIEMGGGVRDRAAVERTLNAGVERAIIGTAAAGHPEAAADLFREFGERLVLALDAKDGKVAIAGWHELSEWQATDLARHMVTAGAQRVIYTDIARDGMGTGVHLENTRRLADALSVPVIASGGVGRLEHIVAVAKLRTSGVEGVIVGKALYSGAVSLVDALAAVKSR